MNRIGARARLLALGPALVLTLGACTSTTEPAVPVDVSVDFDDVSEAIESTTTTEAIDVPFSNFRAVVDRTLPDEADAPSDHTFAVVDLTAELGAFCDAVAPARDQWIAAAEGAVEYEGEHFFRTDVEVYTTPEDASDSYAYNLDALARCDGEPRTDTDTGSTLLVQTAAGGPYDLPGATEAGTNNITIATDTFALDVTMIHARIDNVVLVAQGTDTGTTAYYMDLLMARLLNEPDPAYVAPSGAPNLVEADGSTLDGPAREVRAVLPSLDLHPATAAWFAEADDAVLNEVAEIICPRLVNVPEGTDSFAAIYGDAFTESERAELDLEAGVQAMLVITAPYCPDVYELLTT